MSHEALTARIRKLLTPDDALLLDGVANGYPLPNQHPARELESDERFWPAVTRCAALGLLTIQGNRLGLTPAGRLALQGKQP